MKTANRHSMFPSAILLRAAEGPSTDAEARPAPTVRAPARLSEPGIAGRAPGGSGRSGSGLAFVLALAAILGGTAATGLSAKTAAQAKRLSAKEVRVRLAGKVISDGTHWSYHLKPNGSIDALELGHRRSGKWRLSNGQLCIEIYAGSAAPGCWFVVQDRTRLTLNDSAGPVYVLNVTRAPLRR